MPPESPDYEHHSIWTPELVELSLPLAGITRRLLARLIDEIISNSLVIGIWFVAIYVFVGFAEIKLLETTWLPLLIITLSLSIILKFTYYWLFHTLNQGRTLGKQLLRIRLVTNRLGRPNSWTCFVRSLFDILDIALCYGAFGMLFIIFTKQEKRLADFAAGTLVVLENTSTNDPALVTT